MVFYSYCLLFASFLLRVYYATKVVNYLSKTKKRTLFRFLIFFQSKISYISFSSSSSYLQKYKLLQLLINNKHIFS